MPLDRYTSSNARILPSNTDHIRFDMTGGGSLVAIDLPIKVMKCEFGTSRLEPLAHFDTQRDIIEAVASRIFDALGRHNDYIKLKNSDFENRSSRSLVESGA